QKGTLMRTTLLALAACLLAAPAFAQEPGPPPGPPPPPPRDGWMPARGPGPWEARDPNDDDLFFFPTGRTLRRGDLALGFPGPGGAPDIQYGVSDWLQVGAGYSLLGFTPIARLGLKIGRAHV